MATDIGRELVDICHYIILTWTVKMFGRPEDYLDDHSVDDDISPSIDDNMDSHFPDSSVKRRRE